MSSLADHIAYEESLPRTPREELERKVRRAEVTLRISKRSVMSDKRRLEEAELKLKDFDEQT